MKIDNATVPKIKPSGVPPVLRYSDGFWTNEFGKRSAAGRDCGEKFPTYSQIANNVAAITKTNHGKCARLIMRIA